MSDNAQVWRVVTDDGTVREVSVCRDLGGWRTSETWGRGLATPHAAVMEHAVEQRWPVTEILATGQSSYAELAAHTRETERALAAAEHAVGVVERQREEVARLTSALEMARTEVRLWTT